MSVSRVCFVLPSAYGYFNPDVDAVGGGARQLSFISRELTGAFDVHFVVGDYGQPRRETRDGVVLHRSYEPTASAPPWKKPQKLVQLFGAMRRASADVYVYRGRPYLATITYVLSRALGARWIYNLANDSNISDQPDALSAPVRTLFRRAIHNADAIIAQTEEQTALLSDRYGESAAVIPSGYPAATSLTTHEDRSFFLWVGRLDEDQKRSHLLLDVAEAVPEASFKLVGPADEDTEYSERVRSRIEALDNVTYLGWVPPDEIHELYREAIALVNTSAYEGFPSTFLEAWRVDTPVLSLSLPLSRYSSDEADDGYAGDSIDVLVDLVRDLAENPDRRAALSQPTFEYFQEHLTIDAVADRYRSVLEGL